MVAYSVFGAPGEGKGGNRHSATVSVVASRFTIPEVVILIQITRNTPVDNVCSYFHAFLTMLITT